MQNALSLNELYADFSLGLLDKKELEGAIFKAIQADMCHLNLPGLSREDRDDYVSWLYPRISQAISTYCDIGASFEAYINSLVRLTAKEYRIRQVRSYAAESAAWNTQYSDMLIHEREPEYVCATVSLEKPALLKSPRKHLILLLKCCIGVSEDFLERAAAKLGIELEVLAEMVNTLRNFRQKREKELELLRERAQYQFFRCIFYEDILRTMPDKSNTAQQFRERLERWRNRLAKTRKRLARMRVDPSNSQIAEVLGIAKGTVDAALHNLKLSNVQHPDNANRHILN